MNLTPSKSRDILISGAGIAGPALAYWLHRHGFRPTIVERAAQPRTGGYAVDFRGEVHLGLLERMGLLADIRRAQTHMGAMYYVNRKGRKVARVPADLISGDLEILRGDLAGILYDATKEYTDYLFADSIATLTEQPDGVAVTFERGQPRVFDLVVGADGLHSQVRSLAFGSEHGFITETGLYYAVYTTANDLKLDHTGLIYSTPGKVAAVYSARDNTEAKALLYFASPSLRYDRRDPEQQRRIVADAFADSGWETPRLLAAMRQAPDFYFDSISQVHMDKWSRGRTVLLGDAAYCPSLLSGMGTGLAIVGAYVLAGELAAARGDHHDGFARYEATMRGYVKGCQKLGEGVANWAVPDSRLRAWLANQTYRLIPYLPWKGLLAKSARTAASAIVLDTYASLHSG